MKLEDPKPKAIQGGEVSQTKESEDMRQESMPVSSHSVLVRRYGRPGFEAEIVVTH